MLKKLFVFLFLTVSIYASNLEKVIFVENKDNKDEISLVQEFFKHDTNYYTISVAVLTEGKHNPIEFFKRNKLTNAVAYKFGDDLGYIRIISGVYENSTDAKKSIKNLNKSILKNNPYPIKISRHQKQFRLYNNENNNSSLKRNTTTNIQKDTNDSIYVSGSKNSQVLKNELLKKENSKLYSISVATIPSSKRTVKNFFNNNNISDKALAHVYGKKRDKVRVVYGLYNTYAEAKNAINELNRSLKINKPYPMRMKHFQSFYRKNNKDTPEQNIVQLKVNDKKNEEKVSNVKLNDEIKIIKPEKPTKVKVVKKEKELPKTKVLRKAVVKKTEPKKSVKKPKRVIKQKVVKKRDFNKDRYLKHSKVEDIYYIESEGSFNILNEVFLNDGSSFFTIDLGEIRLSENSMEEFFLENNIANNALSYKYGDKKEFARAIYGAYETKESAKNAIDRLNLTAKNLRVSNIKNHQKLYKTYHENILKRGPVSKPKKVNKKQTKRTYSSNRPASNDIVYVEFENGMSLKDEFFKDNTSSYTITLITFHKDDSSPEIFISNNYIENDLLAFSLGSNNDYYRIIYGVYKTRNEALEMIEKLDDNMLKNKPYISRIKTSKKRFESYNGRKISDYKNLTTQIELR